MADWEIPENDGVPSVWVKQFPEGVEMTQAEADATFNAVDAAARAEAAALRAEMFANATFDPTLYPTYVYVDAALALKADTVTVNMQFDNVTTMLAGKAATVHTHTVAQLSDASANGRSWLQAASYAAMKTLLALVKGDVGLGNVDNTSDANKPVSTAQATSIATKAALAHTHAVADLSDASANGRSWLQAASYAAMKALLSLVKGDVGLGSVDNTADSAKPVSTAQAAADTAIGTAANSYTDASILALAPTTTSTTTSLPIGTYILVAMAGTAIARGTTVPIYFGASNGVYQGSGTTQLSGTWASRGRFDGVSGSFWNLMQRIA